MNVILLASGAVLAILVLLDMTPGTFSHEWWALTAIVLLLRAGPDRERGGAVRVLRASEEQEFADYLDAVTVVLRDLAEWRERYDRTRHLGPDVEAALLAEWRRLADRAEMTIAGGPPA